MERVERVALGLCALCGAPRARAPTTTKTPPPPHAPLPLAACQVRKELRTALEKRMPDRSWSFITAQIGMFSFTGMSPAQVRACGGALLGGLWGACVCWRAGVCSACLLAAANKKTPTCARQSP